MTVRVRFAPSPTGFLHIGGARTALYNYLFARARGGKVILRIEDTDLERSCREYEKLQIDDLNWLGIAFDEGPDLGGDYGPYRQSERQEIYLQYALQLIEMQHAYYCFCSDELLTIKKEQALAENRHPHYDGTCRNIELASARQRLANGEKAVIRFKAKKKSYQLIDQVRGEVNFPEDMVGDFVLIRSNGLPVYNYCNVIDDWLMKITHVIRGEDHLQNTLRQLMLYEAFNVETPIFAHVSLLVGKDRQKLSKRHGATSLHHYREESYLPQAISNYLCLLGWSHPQEQDIFTIGELGQSFDLGRFSKSPAVFDLEKFQWVNGQHIKMMDDHTLWKNISMFIPPISAYHQQTEMWQQAAVNLFKNYLHFYREINPYLESLWCAKYPDFSDQAEREQVELILQDPATSNLHQLLIAKLTELVAQGNNFPTMADFVSWQELAKQELLLKGKILFMGMRLVLTGKVHGPELKQLIPLTPLTVLLERVGSFPEGLPK